MAELLVLSGLGDLAVCQSFFARLRLCIFPIWRRGSRKPAEDLKFLDNVIAGFAQN
jgi:hypothetical protein